MPPVGAKRPDRATADAALKTIEDAVASDSTPDVSGADVAKRLAKLLWNSEPDKALAEAAGGLNQGGIEAQVRRMLADDRMLSVRRTIEGRPRQVLHIKASDLVA